MTKFYDARSYATLSGLVEGHGGDVVASFQVAHITNRPRRDGLPFDRQHVFRTGSGTLLVEQAFDATSCNGLLRKVYWTALVPTPAGVRVEPLDRHRRDHYVRTWDVGSYSWLTTSVMLATSIGVH